VRETDARTKVQSVVKFTATSWRACDQAGVRAPNRDRRSLAVTQRVARAPRPRCADEETVPSMLLARAWFAVAERHDWYQGTASAVPLESQKEKGFSPDDFVST
jgi:hypothetical protein